jgi:hypothetical protein
MCRLFGTPCPFHIHRSNGHTTYGYLKFRCRGITQNKDCNSYPSLLIEKEKRPLYYTELYQKRYLFGLPRISLLLQNQKIYFYLPREYKFVPANTFTKSFFMICLKLIFSLHLHTLSILIRPLCSARPKSLNLPSFVMLIAVLDIAT